MIRRAFTMRLKPDSLAEYKHHHDNIWPELVAEIERAGIASITTFQRDLDLFLVSEIADEAAWDKLWNSEVHKRWAEVMYPLMHLREDGIVEAGELTEVFHITTDGDVQVSAVVVVEPPSEILMEILGEAAAEPSAAEPSRAPADVEPAIQPAAKPRRKMVARHRQEAAGKKTIHKKNAPAKKSKRRSTRRPKGRAAKKAVKKSAKKAAGKTASPKKAKKAAKKKKGGKKRG